jgi:hypothetical protein
MGIPVGTGLDESTGIILRHWLTQEAPTPRPWPDQNKLLLDLCFDISCQSQF